MDPKDMKKIALITKIGLYDWIVMPFGFKNATNTFIRTMSIIFKPLGDRILKIFVDDFNIHNENWGEHLQHLDVVFFKFKEVNLKLTLNKCCFATKKSCFWVMWLIMKAPNKILVRLMKFFISHN
jgi:hypothetical protein